MCTDLSEKLLFEGCCLDSCNEQPCNRDEEGNLGGVSWQGVRVRREEM